MAAPFYTPPEAPKMGPSFQTQVETIQLEMLKLDLEIKRQHLANMTGNHSKEVMDAIQQVNITPVEALFGFAAWLTTRPESITMGAAHDAAAVCELLTRYVETNNLGQCRDGIYPDNLKRP